MVGEMHCHTNLSYPKWLHRNLPTPQELVDYAVSLGLDFIAITDHDIQLAFTQIADYALSKGLVVIPAVEISAKSSKLPHKRPHILAYGVPEKVPSRKSIVHTIDLIHEQGGIAVAAHPYSRSYSKSIYLGDVAKNFQFDGVEVFNSSEGLVENARALHLAEEMHALHFAGSDAHSLDNIGHARISIDIPRTDKWEDLVAALKGRNFHICASDSNYKSGSKGRVRSSSISFIFYSLRGKAS